MRLKGLGRQEREQLEAALRRNERNVLDLVGELPRLLRADQVIPWFDDVRARTPGLEADLRVHLPPGPKDGPRFRVTAVVPTNRGTPVGLQALREQDVEMEVLVLANGGVKAEGDRVLSVNWMGHGPTRQFGADKAEGDYVLFTVDDALPRGRGCVRKLVEALEEGGYDAVFGRQIPWPTSDAVTRERLSRWTPSGRGHIPMERLDHVFALTRRQTLMEQPLPGVPIAEDLRWSRGKRIGYVPGAPVVHAHARSAKELYHRTREIHVQHLLAGDDAKVPSLFSALKALPGVMKPLVDAGPGEVPNQLAEILGQWRAAVEQRRRKRR